MPKWKTNYNTPNLTDTKRYESITHNYDGLYAMDEILGKNI